jgi:hypothetical protein
MRLFFSVLCREEKRGQERREMGREVRTEDSKLK